jgi:hypothetical protein
VDHQRTVCRDRFANAFELECAEGFIKREHTIIDARINARAEFHHQRGFAGVKKARVIAAHHSFFLRYRQGTRFL